MINRIVPIMFKLRRTSFACVTRRTLVMLFPFVLLGSIAQIFQVTVFSKNGFVNSLCNLSNWLPHFNKYRIFFGNFTSLTLGIVSMLAAYQAAQYTARYFHRDNQMAGLTGLITFLLLCIKPLNFMSNGISLNWILLGSNGLLLGLIIGYITGWMFRLLERPLFKQAMRTDDILDRAFFALPAIFGMILLGLIVSMGINFLQRSGVISNIVVSFETFSENQNVIWYVLLLGVLTTVLAWMGLAGPYATVGAMYTDQNYTDNLNYALSHKSAWNVPHQFTATTLYQGFGSFGGVGATLALIIAITLVSHGSGYLRVARWSLLPAFFNNNSPIMIGVPLLFNPMYIIPFILAPLVNMIIAAGAIAIHIMPPLVYPVPDGTPGMLVAFIGTNGNIMALIVGIILLGIDVLLYLPFVKLAERVKDAMKEGANNSEGT
ncbi:PTS transporter subunit EIIC [Ligilactobacillus sp. WILCCON 0076]|uniref:Permease IIC component n=1 Tax=Ligilactobacillus ubinensis TaxID=2876789 RepID=A0A9X2FKE1_9LACO|nr:PTS transporter subunit EIIC [Ligilactobacillus ubinensis]MCP0886809.1 PTS transporter subunit EIIC [Ligilactobacillus ubinensis]